MTYTGNGVDAAAGGEHFTAAKAGDRIAVRRVAEGRITGHPPLPDSFRWRPAEVTYLPFYEGIMEFDRPAIPPG